MIIGLYCLWIMMHMKRLNYNDEKQDQTGEKDNRVKSK